MTGAVVHDHHNGVRFLFEHILEARNIRVAADHLVSLGLAADRLVMDIVTGNELSLMNLFDRLEFHNHTP